MQLNVNRSFMNYLLDTNIVSYAVKNNIKIRQKLADIKFLGFDIFISCITFFEIKRVFLAVDAPKQREKGRSKRSNSLDNLHNRY